MRANKNQPYDSEEEHSEPKFDDTGQEHWWSLVVQKIALMTGMWPVSFVKDFSLLKQEKNVSATISVPNVSTYIMYDVWKCVYMCEYHKKIYTNILPIVECFNYFIIFLHNYYGWLIIKQLFEKIVFSQHLQFNLL